MPLWRRRRPPGRRGDRRKYICLQFFTSQVARTNTDSLVLFQPILLLLSNLTIRKRYVNPCNTILIRKQVECPNFYLAYSALIFQGLLFPGFLIPANQRCMAVSAGTNCLGAGLIPVHVAWSTWPKMCRSAGLQSISLQSSSVISPMTLCPSSTDPKKSVRTSLSSRISALVTASSLYTCFRTLQERSAMDRQASFE